MAHQTSLERLRANDKWRIGEFHPSIPNPEKIYSDCITKLIFTTIGEPLIHPNDLFQAINIFGRYLSGRSGIGNEEFSDIASASYGFLNGIKRINHVPEQVKQMEKIRSTIRDFTTTPYDFLMEDRRTGVIFQDVFDGAFLIILTYLSEYTLNTRFSAYTIAKSAEYFALRKQGIKASSAGLRECLHVFASSKPQQSFGLGMVDRRGINAFTSAGREANIATTILSYMGNTGNPVELKDCSLIGNWFIEIIPRTYPESVLRQTNFRQKLLTDIQAIVGKELDTLPNYLRRHPDDPKLKDSLYQRLFAESLGTDPDHTSTNPDDIIVEKSVGGCNVFFVNYYHSSVEFGRQIKQQIEIFTGNKYETMTHIERVLGFRLVFNSVILYDIISNFIHLDQSVIYYMMKHTREENKILYDSLLNNAYIMTVLMGNTTNLYSYIINPETQNISYAIAISGDIESKEDKDRLFGEFLTLVNRIFDVDGKVSAFDPNSIFVQVKSDYDEKMCPVGWTANDISKGQGQFGVTYEACCGASCGDYVMKIAIFNDPDAVSEFNKETQIGRVMAKSGIGPQIVSAATGNGYGLIVMEAMSIQITKLVLYLTYLKTVKNAEPIIASYKRMMATILQEVYQLINKLHSIGYFHGDLHLGNAMVKFARHSDLVKAITQYERVITESEISILSSAQIRLIDFGYSSPINERKTLDILYPLYSYDFKEIEQMYNIAHSDSLEFKMLLIMIFDYTKHLLSACEEFELSDLVKQINDHIHEMIDEYNQTTNLQ